MTTETAPKPDASPKPRKSRSGTPGGKANRRTTLGKPLTDLFTTMGTMLILVDDYDGTVVVENAERLAKQLDEIAKNNPGVQAALERLVSGSQWGGVVATFGAVAVPIAARHGLIPQMTPALFRQTPPPEVRPLGRRPRDVEPAEPVETPSFADLLSVVADPEPAPQTAATADA